MGSEERVKRAYVQLEQKSSKKQKIAVEDVPHEAEEDMEALVKGNPVSAVPVAIKPPSIANWKIIKLGNKGVLVMQKYGTNGPEDEYERVFWGDLKTMFDPPLTNIYMLTERRYPILADVCQAMLDNKLQGDKKDEA
ncbi:hypothetical protein Tco_1300916 [Tanacetum coccineum]